MALPITYIGTIPLKKKNTLLTLIASSISSSKSSTCSLKVRELRALSVYRGAEDPDEVSLDELLSSSLSLSDSYPIYKTVGLETRTLHF